MMEAVAPPAFSVVIPQWGQFPLTARVVDQLWGYDSSQTEIIVVDDGSPDYTKCGLIGDRRIAMLQQRHRGVTSAWNRGAKRARGTFLVFLNNDVRIEGPFLHRLIQPLDDRGVVMCGCRWRKERGIPRSIASRLPRELLEGWCFAVRRIDFEEIGGFDERFRLYYSDTDLQWRLLSHRTGSRLEKVPDLPLVHEGHVTTRTNPRRRTLHAQDRRVFLQKWSSA